MKKFLLIGLVVAILGVLVAGFASPISAHDPGSEVWEEMHQDCVNGDYEAMAKWHDQCHGEEGAMSGGMMRGGMMGGMH